MTQKRGTVRKNLTRTSSKSKKNKQTKTKKTHKKKTQSSKSKKKSFLKKEKKNLKKFEHEIEEEFFVPSPTHRGKYKIPLGIKLIIGYLTFVGILYIISFMFGLTFPTTILFGQILGGTRAFIINIVLMTILASMIYGFYKRKAYTFDLSIGFFGFTALNAFISLLLIESSNYSIFKPLMLISFLSLASINSVVIWYILHERKFFYAKYFRDKAIHHKDKVFVYTLIAFWCITLLIGLTLGVEFYKTSTKIVDETIVELKEKYPAGEFICYNKESPQKDICILVAVATHQKQGTKNKEDLRKICNNIDSDFYEFSCKRLLT